MMNFWGNAVFNNAGAISLLFFQSSSWLSWSMDSRPDNQKPKQDEISVPSISKGDHRRENGGEWEIDLGGASLPRRQNTGSCLFSLGQPRNGREKENSQQHGAGGGATSWFKGEGSSCELRAAVVG